MNIILFRNAAIVTTIFFKSENLLSSDLHEFWWIMRRVGSSRQPRAVAYGVWVCMITLHIHKYRAIIKKKRLFVWPSKLTSPGRRSDLSSWPYMAEGLTFQVDLTWTKVLPFKLTSHGWRSYLSSWPYLAEGLTFLRPRWIAQAEASGAPAPSTTVPSWANPRQRQHKKI